MKTKLFLMTCVVALAGVAWAQQQPGSALPADDKGKASYSIGYEIGNAMKKQGVAIDPKSFLAGLQDGLGGAKPAMTEKEMRDVLMAVQKEAAVRIPEQNKKDGEAFLAANAKKEGVKSTKTGLQYKVLKEGTGKIPKATDKVKTHYTGTLIDGTKFDSSYDNGEPVTFPVNRVIPGWTEALQLMKVGSKWQLAIPAELAYGKDAPPSIGPNSVLLFDIELLGIEE